MGLARTLDEEDIEYHIFREPDASDPPPYNLTALATSDPRAGRLLRKLPLALSRRGGEKE